MSKVIFYGTIKKGKLHLDRRGIFDTFIQSFKEGQRIELTVEKEGTDSLHWLKYYFACIVQPIAEHTGDTKDEVDGILCRSLLTQNKGTKKEYVKSKTKLTQQERNDFIEGTSRIAAMLGIVVTPPDKEWRVKR